MAVDFDRCDDPCDGCGTYEDCGDCDNACQCCRDEADVEQAEAEAAETAEFRRLVPVDWLTNQAPLSTDIPPFIWAMMTAFREVAQGVQIVDGVSTPMRFSPDAFMASVCKALDNHPVLKNATISMKTALLVTAKGCVGLAFDGNPTIPALAAAIDMLQAELGRLKSVN